MKKLLGTMAAVAMAAVTVLSAGPAGAAPLVGSLGDGATPNVIGGEKAPATPWAVQLLFVLDGQTYGCTGEQITASWVLTAQHCIDGISSMNVYHSNSTINRGVAAPADRVVAAPSGDIALVHLRTAYPLSSYPALDLTATAANSGTGTILGYGARANSVGADALYQATVRLTGSSTDAYSGAAQHLNGSTGAANHGDSGGPLIVNGRIVAVCSTGDESDPGSDTQAGSNYALLSQSASWIRNTAGSEPFVSQGETPEGPIVANRKYTEDQRAEAIRLISVEGQSAASVARELSVSVGTVHRWVSDAIAARADALPAGDSPQSGDGPRSGDKSDLASQLKCVIDRIGHLETQIEQIAQREERRDN